MASSQNIQQMTIPLVSSVLSFAPFFPQSFYRWKASTFSANGPQSSELNIDFIQSLVAVSVTTGCLLGNHAHISSQRSAARREDEGMKMRDSGENPNWSGDDIKTQGGRQTRRRERRRTQGDEKKEQGIWRAAIKRRKKIRKKVVDETGLAQNWKGKEFFFLFFWSAVFNSLFTFTHCPTPATAHLC